MQNQNFYRVHDLAKKVVPFSVPTIWRKSKAGTFPVPVKLSDRVTAWRAADIQTWLQQVGGMQNDK